MGACNLPFPALQRSYTSACLLIGMRPSFYSKSFQASIEDAFQRLQDFPKPPKDADKESLALYAKIHKSLAVSMSDIVDYFDDIAPYANQDEISDIEMSDAQIDKDGDTEVRRDCAGRDGGEGEPVEQEEEQEQERAGQEKDGADQERAEQEEEQEQERAEREKDDADSGADEEEEEAMQTKDNKATVIAREFIEVLYTKVGLQCTLDHFRSTIVPSAKPVRLQGKRPTLLDEDKLAFQRLCYPLPPNDHAGNSITKKTNLESRIRELDKASSNPLQLVQPAHPSHSQLLFKLHDLEASRSFVNFVIRTIIAIRFAQDYKSWPLSEKKNYHKDLFNSYYKSQITQIGNQHAGNDRDKRLERLFKTFKGQHEKVVAARNHLDRLYRIFGVTLFLDPFWQLASGLDAPKHSRPFGKIIALLEQDLEPVNIKVRLVSEFEREVSDGLRDADDVPRYNEVNEDAYNFRMHMLGHQSRNRKFLFKAIKALGGKEVLEFVQDFVTKPSAV
ncbi:hypothetical protein EDD18DRAFT_1116385 [Armillaria luteobubalina]|uniref:Uncharacterized protein n=1 Tax=Armillaria luteobubalina TaxID=153913 RepID=A0AA39NZV1_9AGAR|nr:hypothetical protein EDD18DRAFT_1116385 [Armillaria luteobubalina]